jgi:hypothetical protein
MLSNDVIHIQAEERGEDSNVESIDTPKTDDYLCVRHDVWWHVKHAFTTYKQSKLGQGTCEQC